MGEEGSWLRLSQSTKIFYCLYLLVHVKRAMDITLSEYFMFTKNVCFTDIRGLVLFDFMEFKYLLLLVASIY